jgi:hypothetical protein
MGLLTGLGLALVFFIASFKILEYYGLNTTEYSTYIAFYSFLIMCIFALRYEQIVFE